VHIGHGWRTMLKQFSLVMCILLCTQAFHGYGQDIYNPDKETTPFVYDEIPVLVTVDGVKDFYIDIIYTNNNLLYVNVENLFKTLKIQCLVGQRGDSIGGFIEQEKRTYLIDYNNREIKVGAKTIQSVNGLVKELGSLFIESKLLTDAFGIQLSFNYRTLSIKLESEFELPIVKEQRIEKMRTNLSQVQGEVFADTTIKRNYHLFKAGNVDWALTSYQTWNGPTNMRARLALGTEFLFGEADVSIDYYSQQKFDNRQLQYIWKWVDNDKKIIKQAQAGKISTQSIAYFNSPLVGLTMKNSPTTLRKANGYYTISEFTEPNWTVELYINNVLVNFTKADASGLFVFKVPIVYGYNTMKLKFYGPMGEERSEERVMNIPYTFMPANELEYEVSGGMLQDSMHSRFGKAEFNYGVDRILTVGGGVEYLSSIKNGPYIPFAKASLQPFSKMTIHAEYAHGVKSQGIISYYLGKETLLEIDFSKYVEGQQATFTHAPEERKIKLSMPVRIRKISGLVKLDYSRLIYKEFYYNQGNVMLSMYLKQFSINSATQINWINEISPYVTSDLTFSYKFKSGYNLLVSSQVNANQGSLIRSKAELEKRIPMGYLSCSYERSFLNNDNYVNLNFKYDLSFARTSVSTTYSKYNSTLSESIEGSLAFAGSNEYVHKSNNSAVGKGGIAFYPFLDQNQNGIFDQGEKMVKIYYMSIRGGRPEFSDRDSIVRVPDLNAFTSYIVEFNDNDLENIAWKFKNTRYQIMIDPNQFKRVDIPVIAVGEISGMVYLNNEKKQTGLGRILVNIYKKNETKLLVQTLSESDGYIYYLGLAPGEYTATLDSVQMNKLDYTASPAKIDFTINNSTEGDIVSGLNFVLFPKEVNKPKEQD